MTTFLAVFLVIGESEDRQRAEKVVKNSGNPSRGPSSTGSGPLGTPIILFAYYLGSSASDEFLCQRRVRL